MCAQIERDEYLRPFQSYTNRYRHSYEASYSQDPLYYSNDVGRAPLQHPHSVAYKGLFVWRKHFRHLVTGDQRSAYAETPLALLLLVLL